MGKIERAVRDLMATSAVPAFTTSELCEHVYGEVTKARRVHMLRVMRRLAEAEPTFELGEEPGSYCFDAPHRRNALGNFDPNKQTILYDATIEAACNKANFGDVEPELMGDPEAGGSYATYIHRLALLRAAGDTEAAAELEAARARYMDRSLGGLASKINAAMGVKTPEEIDKELVEAAAQALMAVAKHRGVDAFRMEIEATGEANQWSVTCPRYVSPETHADGGNSEAA